MSPKAEGVNVAKIATLLEAARELQAKQAAVLDELDAIIGGRATIGQSMKRCIAAFNEVWGSRYRSVYRFSPGDAKMLKTLLTTGQIAVEDLQDRMGRFILKEEPYFKGRRHDFGSFSATVNQHVDPHADDDFGLDGGPADCRHTPRCRTDEACTVRRQREMRA